RRGSLFTVRVHAAILAKAERVAAGDVLHQVPPDGSRGQGRFHPTCRYDHTGTLAWASTFCAMGVSSRWKNLMMSPARIGYASSHDTPANILSTYDRVSGQSHSMCGKSVANIKWSTPILWRISIAVRSTCCTLSTMLSRMYSLGFRC